MELSDRLHEILACPACHGALTPEEGGLVCVPCGLRFPIREGVPVLLVAEAEKISGERRR